MSIYAVASGQTALAADLNQWKSLLVDGTDTTTKLGIGATSVQAAATLALPQTSSAGLGFGLLLSPTLTAAANNDALAAEYVKGAVATGTFTGLTASGLLVDGGALNKTGTGTIGNSYGLYATAPTIGSTNWAAGLIGHVRSGGGTPGAPAVTGGLASGSLVGNDTAGTLTVTAGTTGLGAGNSTITVAFAATYGAAPTAVVVCDATGAGGVLWSVSAMTASQFVLVNLGALTSSATYKINYIVIG